MTEEQFQENISGAAVLMNVSSTPYNFFWRGYGRGTRRNYFGERFGTNEEHKFWINPVQTRDQQRKMQRIGYRAGFDGLPIVKALELVKQLPSGFESHTQI